MTEITLSELPSSLRKLIAVFLITLSSAYLVGLGYVYYNTNMTYTGVAEDFRGSETEMKFEKPVGEMFQTIHNHMFGLSLTFFLTGIIFFFSSMKPGYFKTFIFTEPLISIILSFGSFWLIRFVSPEWTILLFLSAGLMGFGFAVQVLFSLFDLLIRPIL